MGRKLASIQRIWKIEPIEGADRIELVRVMGWQCVAKKEEFAKYDLCVYIEIDSVCPKEDERFAMLASTNWKVKTRKMKNTLSQGIALPLSIFGWTDADVTLEEDVSEKLGIKLFENYETFNATEAKGGFPGFIRKTDQERIQNLSLKTFENYSELEWEKTEKLEGSSGTFFVRDSEYFACSRNLVMRLIEGSRWLHFTEKYDLENKLKAYGKNIALQGECIGPGIQGNIYKLKELEFRIFDVFDIDAQRYVNPHERWKILEDLGLMHIHVPILDKAAKFNGKTKDDLLLEADGQSVLGNSLREGIVWKCVTNGDYHFKTVSNKYLLKHDS
jgi:RNA ligase (TIGR02306 family)